MCRHTHTHTHSQMDGSQVCALHSCLDKEGSRGKKGKIDHKVLFLFLFRGWGVVRMQWCVQVKALFNTLWLSPYSPNGRSICPFFCLSAPLLSLSKWKYTCLYNLPTGLCPWLDPEYIQTAGIHLSLLHFNTFNSIIEITSTCQELTLCFPSDSWAEQIGDRKQNNWKTICYPVQG